MRRYLLGLAATAAALTAGCVSEPTEALVGTPARIVTSFSQGTVLVGDSVLVTATLRDDQNVGLTTFPDVASQTPTVVTTSPAVSAPVPELRFYVKAEAFGLGVVRLSYESVTPADITLQTLPGDVSILGAADTLLSGEVVQLGIQPLDVSGNPIVADTIYEWSSADEAVVAVDEDGLASARAPGRAVITLEAPGGGADETAIVVVPGVFGGTLSANSAAPGRLVTATKAAGGPDFDADSKATLAGASAWIEAFTASTMTLAIPATGATTAAALSLSDMGANQIAQNIQFTPTSALDVWSPGNITNDCSDPTSAPSYNTERSANGWLYFSHNGSTQGDAGCYNGGSGYDHFFTYTTNATAGPRQIRAEWKVAGDHDLYVCNATLTSCPITGFSGNPNDEVIAAANLAANTTYYIVFSPYEAGAGSNSVRLRIQ